MKKFEHLIFKNIVEDVIILATNEAMESGGDVLTFSEFLVFLGFCFSWQKIIGPS